MTIFIAHAAEDAAVAEALERFLERRGHFVERETGAQGFRYTQSADVVVTLWSRGAMFSPYRLVSERRTLEAWADERLVFVKLDAMFAPVGLRDLPAIDASFEAQRDIAWAAVAKAAQDRLDAARQRMAEGGGFGSEMGGAGPRDAEAPPPPMSAPAPQAPGGSEGAVLRRQERRSGPPKRRTPWGALFGFLLLVGALVAAFIALPHLPLDRSAVIAGMPVDRALRLGLVGLVAAAAVLAVVTVFRGPWAERRRRSAGAAPPRAEAPAAPAPAPAAALFVSYAHADADAVAPVLEVAEREGRPIWIDKAGLQAGDGWAGEIVRAIRAAGGVMVMCSARAFESDHVKREIYLADRYKKPMLPILLEDAPMPEDFEYFFAGVQWLNLTTLAEADRPAAIARALAAV